MSSGRPCSAESGIQERQLSLSGNEGLFVALRKLFDPVLQAQRCGTIAYLAGEDELQGAFALQALRATIVFMFLKASLHIGTDAGV